MCMNNSGYIDCLDLGGVRVSLETGEGFVPHPSEQFNNPSVCPDDVNVHILKSRGARLRVLCILGMLENGNQI